MFHLKSNLMCTSEMDELFIDSTPFNEPCLQAGSDPELQRAEAIAMINMLHRVHSIPPGVSLRVNRNHHDFGVYYDIVIKYVADSETENFVLDMEGNIPEKWDEEAREELTSKGYFMREHWIRHSIESNQFSGSL